MRSYRYFVLFKQLIDLSEMLHFNDWIWSSSVATCWFW